MAGDYVTNVRSWWIDPDGNAIELEAGLAHHDVIWRQFKLRFDEALKRDWIRVQASPRHFFFQVHNIHQGDIRRHIRAFLREHLNRKKPEDIYIDTDLPRRASITLENIRFLDDFDERVLTELRRALYSNNPSNELRAYPDSKCVYGYMTLCSECVSKAPKHVDTSKPLSHPPAKGKKQRCELCGRKFVLQNNPKRRSPEEDWTSQPESEGPHDFDDSAHSPTEGDIPPWAQSGREAAFPMKGRVLYLNAYTILEWSVSFTVADPPDYQDNLQKYGWTHVEGKIDPAMVFGTDYDLIPWASIPFRFEDADSKNRLFDYLIRLGRAIQLPYNKLVVERDFPKSDSSFLEKYLTDRPTKEIAAYRKKLRPFSHRNIQYAAAWVENRYYGGPHEGGWWYDAGDPVAAYPVYIRRKKPEPLVAFVTSSTSISVPRSMIPAFEYLNHTIGYTSPYPLSSVLGHDTFALSVEDSFPRSYPSERPHYE